MSHRIAVVYHSRHGTVRALAALAAEGAREAGAEVRLLRVADDGAADPGWPERPAEPEDVLWADGLVLACPTYYGNVSSPFKRFLESTSPLWRQGLLADRVATGITVSTQRHGGREATLTALQHTLYHWGCWVAGADPADPVTRAAGGTPYGLAADNHRGDPAPHERAAARALGRRLAHLTARARATPAMSPLLTTVPARRPAPAGQADATAPGEPAPGAGPHGALPEGRTDSVVRPACSGVAAGVGPGGAPAGGRADGGARRARSGRLDATPRPVRLAVVYHGEDAATRILAQEAAAAGRALGSRVRLRRVPGGRGGRPATWLGPWAVPATPEDIAWADAVLFGAPVRLGALAAPLLDFVQALEPAEGGRSPLWGKPASGFATSPATHAGSETAVLGLGHMLLHAGAVLVPPGYTDPAVEAAGGNPYGTCHPRTAGDVPTPQARAAVAHQGRRTALAGDLLRRAPRPRRTVRQDTVRTDPERFVTRTTGRSTA
ncbi:flavodoxin family protein [Streptomyces sp. NPDC049099]|uniref:flavodoxin family protein n=1 Tax=Streptomyces sp. NPDC049099 TaxID=3155768 RepID=UPI003423936D